MISKTEVFVFKGQTHKTSYPKQKLTLSVNKDLVQLAKKAEINLSATFENLLRILIEGR